MKADLSNVIYFPTNSESVLIATTHRHMSDPNRLRIMCRQSGESVMFLNKIVGSTILRHLQVAECIQLNAQRYCHLPTQSRIIGG